mmetsp:Transcript_82309/g.241631  ORF Transcript_82309/g.241631 Transcript_82309/m.241631 type:complete len:263 (-) Transcript_82309:29-817(-)
MQGESNWFPFVDKEPESEEDELTKHVFRVGPFDIPLLLKVIIDPDQIDYDEKTGSDATGIHLWPSSTVVVGLMLSYGIDQLRGASVLELGCGTGFCGLVASRLARHVVLSDRDKASLNLARRNSDLQPHPVEIATYGWEPEDSWPSERSGFALVLASDVLYTHDCRTRYEPAMLDRFFRLIDWSLAPHGTAIIGHVERNQLGHDDLLTAARPYFDVERLDAMACVGETLRSRAGGFGMRSTAVFCCTRRGEPPLLRRGMVEP